MAKRRFQFNPVDHYKPVNPLAGLNIKQLKTLRDKVILESLREQGSSYRRGKNGKFRSVTTEQKQLLAINAAIRKLQAK